MFPDERQSKDNKHSNIGQIAFSFVSFSVFCCTKAHGHGSTQVDLRDLLFGIRKA